MIDPQTIIAENLTWERTPDPSIPWRTRFSGHVLEIHFGDWPSEAPYMLYIDGDYAGDLEGWPEQWRKSN